MWFAVGERGAPRPSLKEGRTGIIRLGDVEKDVGGGKGGKDKVRWWRSYMQAASPVVVVVVVVERRVVE